MENTVQKLRKRLRAATLSPRITVDREGAGRINGVSVITTGPALGHGFQIDAEMVQQTSDALQGQPGRWTHGNMCDDGLGKHLGAWENARVEEFTDDLGEPQSRALADFVFAQSAHKIMPDGLAVSAPEYLMDRTEEDPSSLGISIVADLTVADPDEADVDGDVRLARLEVPADLKRADFVADPAANRTGLSMFAGTPSELAEEGTHLLARIIDQFSQERVTEFLEKALDAKIVPLADVASSRAELSTLKIEVTSLKDKIKTRRELDVDSYLESLAKASAEAQNPLLPADLTDVRELFSLGKDDAARKFGDALLRATLSQSQGIFGDRVISDLAPKVEDPKLKSIAAQAKLLRSLNWTVELSEGGTKILRAEPPKSRF